MTSQVYRIEAGGSRPFVAAIMVTKGIAHTRAPILRYMNGWTEKRLLDYVKKQGWQILLLNPYEA